MVVGEFNNIVLDYISNTVFLDKDNPEVFHNIYNLIMASTASSITECIDKELNNSFGFTLTWDVIYFLTDLYIYLKTHNTLDFINGYVSSYMEMISTTDVIKDEAKKTALRQLSNDKVAIVYVAIYIASRNRDVLEHLTNLNKA